MNQYEKLACESLNCKEVITIAHISSIVEGMDDPAIELTRENYLEAKLFDLYDQYVDVNACYGKNTIGDYDWFFKVETPLGPIAYITDNYPLMYIPK